MKYVSRNIRVKNLKNVKKRNIYIYIYCYLYPCLVSKKEQNKCGNGDLFIGDLANVVRKIIMYIFVLGKTPNFFYFQKGAVSYIKTTVLYFFLTSNKYSITNRRF